MKEKIKFKKIYQKWKAKREEKKRRAYERFWFNHWQ